MATTKATVHRRPRPRTTASALTIAAVLAVLATVLAAAIGPAGASPAAPPAGGATAIDPATGQRATPAELAGRAGRSANAIPTASAVRPLASVSAEPLVASRHGVLVFDPDPFSGYNGTFAELGVALGEPVTTASTLPDAATVDQVLLVVVPAQAQNLTASVKEALDQYAVAGGSLLVLGDNANYYAAANAAINDLTATIGVGITDTGGSYDRNFHITTDVLADPLTVGVTRVSYAWASALSVSGTARTLVRGVSGQIILAAQAQGAGLVTVMGDVNGFADDNNDWAGADNATLAANLVIPAGPSCDGADLALTGVLTPTTLAVGVDGSLTVTVTNRGACQVFGARVTITPGPSIGTDAHIGTPTHVDGTFAPGPRLWSLPPLTAGATASLELPFGAIAGATPRDAEVSANITGAGFPADVTPTDFSVTLPFTLIPPAPGSIVGTVRAGGVGVSGVHVVAYDARMLWVSAGFAVTDDDGSFHLDNLAPGAYRLRATDFRGRYQNGWLSAALGRATGLDALTQPHAQAVNVPSGGTLVQAIDLDAKSTGAIGGLVTDAGGVALANVWVQVQLPPGRLACGCATDGFTGFVAGAITGPQGGFTIRGLVPGRYYLRFVDQTATLGPRWFGSTAPVPPTGLIGIDVTDHEVDVTQRLS